ncbi:MAG: 50S ribosomal protein L18 [Phycisphaerales bacterium]|nr:50S ribosomal protein L18 [Phycisphaerales bacterium]
MNNVLARHARRARRKKGIRKGILGVPGRPRLSVFRSSKHMYAQVIDDLTGRTLLSASTTEKGVGDDNGGNIAAAAAVGTLLAERAGKAGISKVVFDRNGFRYHGRVKSLADAARKGGMEF